MKVAALQMVSGLDVASNLATARDLLVEASMQGAELAVLPEYFCLMGRHDTDKLAVQESYGSGPIQDFLAQCARRLGLWIVGGTVPLSTGDPRRVSNTAIAYDPQGNSVARYDKIHLFRFDDGNQSYDESVVLQAGNTPQAFDLLSVDGNRYRIGMSICYDLRFPELYRSYEADLLLVPSAFTYVTGHAHWEVLLRARAVENLAYVLASAQGGSHDNGRQTWGHSMIVDPWGAVVTQKAEFEAGVVLAEINLESIRACRQKLPALKHRVIKN